MASFSRLSRWPVGYFETTTRWLLFERKNVPARLGVISAELSRIGNITVGYRGIEEEDGTILRTEERIAFSVTENTSLARLVQAYVAAGGNPFDISPFWSPGRTQVVSVTDDGIPTLAEEFPFGGVVSPRQGDPLRPADVQTDSDGNRVVMDTGNAFLGGQPNSPELAERLRLGTDTPLQSLEVVQPMHHIRAWANQEIKEKLQDIEWRIIKLMDLREQLERERDDYLVRNFGGVLNGLTLDSSLYNPKTTMQSLIQGLSEILYEYDKNGNFLAYRAGPNVDLLEFAYESLLSEILRDSMS